MRNHLGINQRSRYTCDTCALDYTKFPGFASILSARPLSSNDHPISRAELEANLPHDAVGVCVRRVHKLRTRRNTFGLSVVFPAWYSEVAIPAATTLPCSVYGGRNRNATEYGRQREYLRRYRMKLFGIRLQVIFPVIFNTAGIVLESELQRRNGIAFAQDYQLNGKFESW